MKLCALGVILSIAVVGAANAEGELANAEEQLQWMVSAYGGEENYLIVGLSTQRDVKPGDRIATNAKISEAYILMHEDYTNSPESLRPREATNTVTLSSVNESLDVAMDGAALSSGEPVRSMEPFSAPDTGIASYGPISGHQGWWCSSGWIFLPMGEAGYYNLTCADDDPIPYR